LTTFLRVETKITIRRSKPTAAALSNLYDIILKSFQDTNLYYTQDETEKLKEKEKLIILERGNKWD
jgi:hypothetical protein